MAMQARRIRRKEEERQESACKGSVRRVAGIVLSESRSLVKTQEGKYPKATACLVKDHDGLLNFYGFPADHWRHLHTTNPIVAAGQGHLLAIQSSISQKFK